MVVFHPRDPEVELFLSRIASGQAPKKTHPAPHEVAAPIRPYPAINVRNDFAVQPRIEAIAVAEGDQVCTNEDLIRNSAYNWSPMSADEISAKTGIEAASLHLRHASRTSRCGPPGRRWRTPRWVPRRSAR